ncbi:DUF2249 domain-containing protein [Rhizomonospora bruguierae]|uniref:DUF2249 domain-containing protein n=1 Tax=Rhizomonospora bruguierae TaxID=1581705 RepID=UPI001BD057F8|nr:DUF2249 domain-containing protein [Micromonospora sp. NBRC 107566]
MSQSDADRAAATAVVAHHTRLAADLTRHVAALRVAAAGAGPDWRPKRETLAQWLRTELLPHATAEEAALYPAAAAQPGGRLLVDGMLAEHRTIGALVTALETAETALDAAVAGGALATLFEVHLAKENGLVLPLLLDAAQVSVADLLAGMHDLLGADEAPDAGCGCGGCGCGGDRGAPDAPVPTLSVDARIDVRSLPHGERHARVLAALDSLAADAALVLVAPHAPRPLLAEIDARYQGQIDTQWLQEGPDVWQIRLHRLPVAAA